jgi:hypothetical protein
MKRFFQILAFGSALLACTGTTTSTPADGGSVLGNDGSPDTTYQRVALSSQLGPGTEAGVNDTGKCQVVTQPWLVVGDDAHPLYNGDMASGTTVGVVCSVTPEGDGFHVEAKALLVGQGSVLIQGHFAAMGTQSNLSASFQRADTGTFEESDCTADYAAKPYMGVAAGRVWATVTCPHATDMATSRTCLASGEIRFENCKQQ